MEKNITVLRVFHEGEINRKKLETFLEEADVIGTEIIMSINTLRNFELILNHSNPKYRDSVLNKSECEGDFFIEILKEQTAKHKPIAFMEHYSEEFVSYLNGLTNETTRLCGESRRAFASGDLSEAIKIRKRALRVIKKHTIERNQEIIAKGPYILKRSQRITGKNDVNYTFVVGAEHNIAKRLAEQTNVPVRDVFIPFSPYTHIHSELFRVLDFNLNDDLALASGLIGELLSIGFVILDSTKKFAQEELPEKYKESSTNKRELELFLRNYFGVPLAYKLLKDKTIDKLTELSKFLGSNNPDSREEAIKLTTKYFGVSSMTSEDLRKLFPFEEAKSEEPIIVTYNPGK